MLLSSRSHCLSLVWLHNIPDIFYCLLYPVVTKSNRTKQLCIGCGGGALGEAGMAPSFPPWLSCWLNGRFPGEAAVRGAIRESLGLPYGPVAAFLCHRAANAKANISFEIKWKPQEVFILEEEAIRQSTVLDQGVVFPQTQLCTPCVGKSEGIGKAGIMDGAKETGHRVQEGTWRGRWLCSFPVHDRGPVSFIFLIGGIRTGLPHARRCPGDQMWNEHKAFGTAPVCFMENGGCEFY